MKIKLKHERNIQLGTPTSSHGTRQESALHFAEQTGRGKH